MTEEEYWKIVWKNVRLSARYGAGGGRVRKNIPEDHHQITITIDDLKELWTAQDGKCYWLGIDMSLEDLVIKNSPFAVSVERLDSTRGYHLDNVVLASRFANRGRGAYDNPDFLPRITELLSKAKNEENSEKFWEKMRKFLRIFPAKFGEKL